VLAEAVAAVDMPDIAVFLDAQGHPPSAPE